MKTVAVLGGGPGGSFAAERLARAGVRTLLFDEKLAWEKPCGGGLTYKAYKTYPFLLENSTPKKFVSVTNMTAPAAGTASLALDQPLLIYSRTELNGMLLERAARSGAHIEKTRVIEARRDGSKWRLRTRDGSLDADYCIVATGARNPLRNVGTEFAPADSMCAIGYRVPGEQGHIDIQFMKGLEGYLWVFPRCGHLSVGICGKGESTASLRARLEQYMREHAIPIAGSEFYAHMLPSLEWSSWRRNRIAGDGWMAVGDAAGLVDPVTGEGLYYAMRSGDLAAETLLTAPHSTEARAHAYQQTLRRDFIADLEFGAVLAKRVYQARFLFSTVPIRMIQFTRRSPRFRTLMQDLFAGTQPYTGLKARLLDNLNGTLHETVMNRFLHRLIPSQEPISL